MKAVVYIGSQLGEHNQVTVTGPDNICIPVLKYIAVRILNSKSEITIHFIEKGKDE